MSAPQTRDTKVTGQEWGGACDSCRVTWAWPRNPKQLRRVDLVAARCPRCGRAQLRPAVGQAAYPTIRVGRVELQVDRCQATAGCLLPNFHNQRSGWPCRGEAGRL